MNRAEHLLNVRVELSEGGETVCIFLRGELDLSSSPDLLAQLQESHARGISEMAVDLSELDFIDSTGLSVLITMRNRARQEKKGFVLISPSPQFLSVVQATGLEDFFEIDDSTSAP